MDKRTSVLLLAAIALALLPVGCSRRTHRLRADADADALINQKSLGTPWQLPRSYSIYPDPDSRLADPTDPDFPWLPSPGPILYSGASPPSLVPEEVPPPALDESLPEPDAIEPPEPMVSLRRLPRPITRPITRPILITHPVRAGDGVQLASYQATAADEPAMAPLPDEMLPYGEPTTELEIQPVPPESFNVLPASSLRHMLEFESVRQEYEKTFSGIEDVARRGAQRRLSLAQIVDLAVRNSRQYQTEEERLYVTALNVSLQRYDYQLKFSPSGNGIDVNYNHARENDRTISNRLSLPSSLGLEKTFAAGGTLVTRFANDVVLNFNGAQGVASRISSDLLFGFTQSILQRDILLDPLIQAERDLVYAARDFARFRKEFFFDVASAYYGILSTYRSVEIDSQNYFSLVRTVEQARAEVRAGVKTAPNQVAVDQYEQSMLSGRSALIATTNQLESELDRLKLTLGLPTDLPLDIDLSELERLTLFDEIEVALERVGRWRERVEEQRQRVPIDRADLVNAGSFMIERLLEWAQLQQSVDGQVLDLEEIKTIHERLQLDQAHNDVERNEEAFDAVSRADISDPTILVFLRATVLLGARLQLIDRQLQILRDLDGQDPTRLTDARDRWQRADDALSAARNLLEQNPGDEELDAILDSLRPVLDDMRDLAARLDQELRYDPDLPSAAKDEQAIDDIRRLVESSDQIIAAAGAGLPEVNINVNDAVLTALIQRLDLMNERGFLADHWRRIKFAADDLRSVLNLSAQHRLSTVNDELPSHPLEFDVDGTNTDLRLSLDLPLNRRAQRNAYRRSLIAYQQGRRNLMELEDNIKFDIRNGLRNVELMRMQYPIRVTQAALAAEQVISIRLQLALGTPNVRGTDLLDALQGSREALTAVANLRINDLVNRTQFVLNMELMQLDDDGFWPSIDDPDYQPGPNLLYPPAAGPTYGEIPPLLKPSRIMYHIYRHPRPGERIEQH